MTALTISSTVSIIRSDLWSAGCVIYEMAYLKPPFRAEDMEGLYKKVVKGQYQRLPGHYSVDLNDFVGYMLKVSPKSRYSCRRNRV